MELHAFPLSEGGRGSKQKRRLFEKKKNQSYYLYHVKLLETPGYIKQESHMETISQSVNITVEKGENKSKQFSNCLKDEPV